MVFIVDVLVVYHIFISQNLFFTWVSAREKSDLSGVPKFDKNQINILFIVYRYRKSSFSNFENFFVVFWCASCEIENYLNFEKGWQKEEILESRLNTIVLFASSRVLKRVLDLRKKRWKNMKFIFPSNQEI